MNGVGYWEKVGELLQNNVLSKVSLYSHDKKY